MADKVTGEPTLRGVVEDGPWVTIEIGAAQVTVTWFELTLEEGVGAEGVVELERVALI